MSSVQFVSKEENTDGYLFSIKKAIEINNSFNIIQSQYLTILYDKISYDIQKGSTIKREDMLIFGENISVIFHRDDLSSKFIECYKVLISQGRTELEISYEIVSIAEDIVKEFEKDNIAEAKRKENEAHLRKIREEDEKQSQIALAELEDLMKKL